MFSPAIVESDAFLDMPTSSQALYFHLGMYADDDGFVNPKRIMRMVGVSDDDLRVIIAKRFVLPFENGVVVIKHWKINNLIRKDWYQETKYLEQKKQLKLKDNGAYTEADKHIVNELLPNSLTQVRLGKDRLDINRVESPSEIGITINKDDYLLKFKKPSKVYSSSGLLAKEISEWSNKELKFPMLLRLIKLKGEQFIRETWNEVKQDNSKEPYKLFMWKIGQIKIELK